MLNILLLIKNLFKKQENSDVICNLNKSKKLFFTGHEELSISANTEAEADEVSKIAYNVLQKYKDKPHLILKFIEAKGTKVVLAPTLLPLLKFLGYDEGFIPKHSGNKARILNFAIQCTNKEKPNLKAEVSDLFITCKKDLSLYFLAYQFHHWLAYQHKLPGYDAETMSLFKNTFNTKANMSMLSINQILSIKDAVDREKQAIDFVRKFVREQVGAKERLNSILLGKKVKI